MEKEIVCKGVVKMSGEKKYRVELEGKEDFLWITDNREQAEEWKAQGRAVLIYLHEGNRGQDFSGFRYAVEEPEDLDEVYVERIYRRLKGLPWKILETERCIVRETTEDDVEDFYNIYQEPAITKYMEGLFPEKSAERQYIREYIEKVYGYYEFGVWTVLEKESGAVIGRAGFSYREGYEEPELGYIIGVPWQRKGYAEEVCRGILDFGWKELGFGAVQVLVETENEPSLHLCRKLGFTGEEIVQIGGRKHYRLVKTG